MKQLTWLLISLCIATSVNAQYVYTINADSVKITNHCDTAELILENHTQTIPGFLFNTGLGRTQFRRGLVQISATQYVIGADTLTLQSGVDTVGNIYSMVNLYHPATPKLVFVADSIDGGLFRYQATPAQVDSGKVFSAAAVGSGYWIRIIEQQAIANPWWYGLRPAVGADTTGAHRNAIALNRCLRHNRNVLIPGGNYYIDSTIFVTLGSSLGGTKSQGTAGATVGTAIVTTDTVTAVACTDIYGSNSSTYVHDLNLINTAGGGKLNCGLFVGSAFFSIERVYVTGFGQDGFLVDFGWNGIPGGQANGGTFALCSALSNGLDGFHVGTTNRVNNIHFNDCYTASNQGSGFYIYGINNMLTNASATNNARYAIDDEVGSNTFINPMVAYGVGDTIMLNGFPGVLEGGIGGNYILSGSGVLSSTVNEGFYHGTQQAWMQSDWTGLHFDQDSIFTWIPGTPGTICAGSYISGTPTGPLIGLNGLNGQITTTGLQLSRVNVPSPASGPQIGKLVLQNSGVAGPSIWSDNQSVILGGDYPYSPDAVTSIGTLGPQNTYFGPGGGNSYYGIQGLLPTDGLESGGTMILYPRQSSVTHQIQIGLAMTTSMDSGLVIHSNAHNFYESIDTLHGQVNFVTSGTKFLFDYYGIDQTNGGNFNFENQDGSSNLYLNTYNHSAYSPYFKTGPTPTATATDSLVAWEPADSGFRKIAQNQLVINRGHTIFTPSSGGSVTLVDNQINIINPSSGIASLSVSFPGSAANNDIIIVKFVKGVTSLSWTGTDTPSGAAAGGYYTFTYDSASGSWY